MGSEMCIRDRYNDGKGKPLEFVMLPLSSPFFQEHLGLRKLKVPTASNLGEGRITIVIHLLDYITELRQKVRDQVDELNKQSRCVKKSELKDAHSVRDSLQVQQGDVKSELFPILKDVRSGQSDSQALEDFCNKQSTIAHEEFAKCEKIHQAVQPRIMFAEDCEKYGAKYLEHPLQPHIDRACDEYENVYVLFDGEADDETTRKNHLAFIELAKNGRSDSTTAFYFTFTESTGYVTIKQYRNRKCVHEDVAKELETKNMVQCIPAARRAFYLVPVKVRCPGSYDGDCSREELSWTCDKCHELLQLCPYDDPVAATLYCRCGDVKTLKHQFHFRCGGKDHGSNFMQIKNNELRDYLTSRYGNCLFAGGMRLRILNVPFMPVHVAASH